MRAYIQIRLTTCAASPTSVCATRKHRKTPRTDASRLSFATSKAQLLRRLVLRQSLPTLSRSTTSHRLRPGGVELLIDRRVAHDRLHVLTRLGERDRLYELFHIAIFALPAPVIHTVRTGVVGGQRILHLPTKLVHHRAE